MVCGQVFGAQSQPIGLHVECLVASPNVRAALYGETLRVKQTQQEQASR